MITEKLQNRTKQIDEETDKSYNGEGLLLLSISICMHAA